MNDLDLIDLIYSATEDPLNGWPAVIRAFGDLYPEARTMLGTYQAGEIQLNRSATDIEDGAVQAYQAHYGNINPVVPPLLEKPAEVYFDADELVPHDEFIKTEVYNDFWRPLGDLRRNVGVVLENSNGLFSTFCTHYPKGLYDDQSNQSPGQTIRRVMPHLRRALRLQAGVEASNRMSASLLDQMSMAGQAVFILGHTGRIQNQNGAADMMLANGQVFWVSPNQRLHLHNARVDERFQARLRLASGLEEGEYFQANDTDIVRTASGDLVKVHVSPAIKDVDPSHRFCVSPERRVLVRVQYLGPRDRLDDLALRLAFGLTPAETRLADSLHSGATLQSYSDATGISVHTARNQLRAIFDKTGTRRQAELTALLSSFT